MTTPRTARHAHEGAPDLPAGWEIQRGASGWRCLNPTRLWSTDVYLDKDGVSGQERAINAAVVLEQRAERALDEQRRLCEGLRNYFAS